MAFALPLFAQLFDFFQSTDAAQAPRRTPAAAAHRCSVGPAPVAGVEVPEAPTAPSDAPLHPAHTSQRHWGGPIRSMPLQRPLRVVRVVEGRPLRAGAGRMVISGRMADVCAELDRLAELETQH